jgi:hypothetical protein
LFVQIVVLKATITTLLISMLGKDVTGIAKAANNLNGLSKYVFAGISEDTIAIGMVLVGFVTVKNSR